MSVVIVVVRRTDEGDAPAVTHLHRYSLWIQVLSHRRGDTGAETQVKTLTKPTYATTTSTFFLRWWGGPADLTKHDPLRRSCA